ncbi:MAG: hypothetical protein F4Y71_00140 [Acidobacteria bacterium]|nr:hypothetical protein [Acidobacteriota bacterium]MYG75074.1 hypothetical protein [Acidobacteriota bacterium]
MNQAENQATLRVVQRLHAKLYAADDSRAILGSSNLSEGGFDHNIELVIELSGDTARDAVSALHAECARHSRDVSLEQLGKWIARSHDTVRAARAAAAEEPEALAEVQADLDQMLGFGTASSALSTLAVPDVALFISWLETTPGLPGAQVILDRYRNTNRQNLSGHVKQCFFGAVRFLWEHPEFVPATSDALDQLRAQDVYEMADPALRQAWTAHLDAHALDRGESFSYPTLRGILPPSLGGTRQGGGGGISTFKRLVPLVARRISEGHLRVS